MKALQRFLGAALVAACALGGVFGSASAGAQPAQNLRVVVPYAAGGSGDLIARTLGERVAASTGQNVVIDNKPGGGTVIGAQSVFASPANGQHVLFIAASFVINPSLMKQMPFDAMHDFVPVTLLASNPHILLVSNQVPANTLAEFIAWAKSKQGSASFASFGNGSSGHLGFELFKMAGKFDMIHVPYKGAAPAMTDLMGGQVDAMLADLPQAIEQIKAGKVKPIAVASATRASTLPNVPTFTEAGLPGFESKSWYGLVVRSGTPPAQVAALNTAFTSALREPAVREKFAQNGLDIAGTSAADFGVFMASEAAKYAAAVKFSGARID